MGHRSSDFRSNVWQEWQESGKHFTIPISDLKTARNVANRCSRKDYTDETIAHPELCLIRDHGAQIESFLSKSLASVWQAQVAPIRHRGKPLILLYYRPCSGTAQLVRAWESGSVRNTNQR